MSLDSVLGPARRERLRNTSVLMVGAGGIGCELLKNLILSGFGTIHVVDLDTITLSNLNRQFLFRHKDIDRSKALTVVEAVQSFNYDNCTLEGHHGNIMDTDKFPIEWWDQFSYIFNALDNLEARRYVNKMALFLHKPLMESGTTGYDGQIQPIFPYVTECFECQPKVTPKTFPVCTIRSTPSQPIHCITWAKEFLYHQLFDDEKDGGQPEVGGAVEGNDGSDNQPPENAPDASTVIQNLVDKEALEADSLDQQEIDNLLRESNELAELRRMVLDPKSLFARDMIHKIFQVDIERLIAIESLWKSRRLPEPLDMLGIQHKLDQLLLEPEAESILVRDTSVWSELENLYVLIRALESLQQRICSEETSIPFDKDDEDALNFVVAAANLRSMVFHIEVMSKFDIKQIAGNIIPAIATTNAIISGFLVLASLDFYNNDDLEEGKANAEQSSNGLGALDPQSGLAINHSYGSAPHTASTVFTSIRPNKYVTAAGVSPPNPRCPACSSARGILQLSQKQPLTVKQLVDAIKDKYGYLDIGLILGKSRLIYDVDFDDNEDRQVFDVGMASGVVLQVQDEDDELENLEFYIAVGDDNLLPEVAIGKKLHEQDEEDNNKEDEIVVDVDGDDVVETVPSTGAPAGGAPTEVGDDGMPPAKRQRVQDIVN